ncbi:MAG: hypothetical protein MUC63_06575, partial [Planctomycetes bacterium]|nr:hypothetical protein [Planctomycetota bacterium]
MNTKPFLSGIAWVALVWASAPASADFGPIGVDCRELAMGGAAAADARGPSAVYWNPAGLRRDSGLRGVLGFGMMQHPDFGESEYGVTDRPFLGVSWAPEDEKGPLSLGAALERPFPRFGYDGRGVVAAGSPAQLASLDMTSSQDYLEILAGVGVRVLGTKVSDLELTIDAGMSLGLGFSSNEVYASLDDLATLAS